MGDLPNILFLDIDGVVNTRDHLRRQKIQGRTMNNRDWCPVACRHINLLSNVFDVHIVISSTWRYDHSMEELRSLFKKNGLPAQQLIDTTPALIAEKQAESFCRGDEIKRWLEANSWQAFVIIDDAPASRFLEEQQEHLVLVDPQTGFAAKKAARRAGKILSNT